VVVEARQEPALAGSSQATAVEIPDDDVPPPGWDQWESLPTPAPEPQEGALVRRWDGHMVTGGSRRGVEASSSRAAPPGLGEERVDEPPAFADAQEEQQLWEELRDHGASLNRALNEALRIHGGPAWRVFQVRRCCRFLRFRRFRACSSRRGTYWFRSIGGRSSSTAPATSTAPLTR
jgi:hypothetical protein